ncbi:hexaprenyldihydroxybenzoate methyltransferase mitochondrial precursor [Decorospora gaudefroyi]|uniref:Ubiquinone biosynthesis O-methyltransferase, mitochondrial n=1 Tax=Decorospora gaudefroyi TaxID=184978 RepID=A0A6A5K7F6_9PLEO|nr:hexaprenyldihydroxybenzoate methyltransferase mitochondrial precursor [Decorospora gaudefroyi]
MKPQNPARAIRSIRTLLSQNSCHNSPFQIYRRRTPNSQCLSTTTALHHNPSPTPNSTVDPTEVSHFNALASSWWDPHGPSRLLHLMNPLRHDFINQCRSSTSTSTSTPTPRVHNLRYLDIGCGGGIFAESAARLPSTHSVTAIDPTPAVLRIAESHKRRDPTLCEPSKLTYLNTSIEDLPQPTAGGGYDIVTLFEVIEHVNAPGPFLEHVLPHVKPGGWLVLSTIARTWTSWVVTNVMAEDVLGIVPKGTHEWSKYVNEGELRNWFAEKKGWGGQGGVMSLAVVYVPGLGWKEVKGGEQWGNYFFGVRRDLES